MFAFCAPAAAAAGLGPFARFELKRFYFNIKFENSGRLILGEMEVQLPVHVQQYSGLLKYYQTHREDRTIVLELDFVPVEELTPVTLGMGQGSFTVFNCLEDVRVPLESYEGSQLYEPVFVGGEEAVYIGQFEEGLRQGVGLIVFSDGSFYEGTFANGTAEGNGRLFYSDDAYYVGMFKNGKKHGAGVYYGPNREVIKAVFKDDFIVGNATVTYIDGATYTGALVDFKKEGSGKFMFNNGDFYEGKFADDLFSGSGKYFKAKEKTLFEGQWENNDLVGTVKIRYPNDSFYEGDCKGFKRHGKGKFYEYEKVYEGNWVNDLKEGVFQISVDKQGICKYAYFKNNAFHRVPKELTNKKMFSNNFEELTTEIVKRPNSRNRSSHNQAADKKKFRCSFFCF